MNPTGKLLRQVVSKSRRLNVTEGGVNVTYRVPAASYVRHLDSYIALAYSISVVDTSGRAKPFSEVRSSLRDSLGALVTLR